MAKRGSTRPHIVKFEYSNSVKGTATFGSEEEAVDLMDQLERTAAQQDMTVRSQRFIRTASGRDLVETRGEGA